MLRITIEQLPLGSEERKQTVAIGTIINTGVSGSLVFGDYEVMLTQKDAKRRSWKRGEVKHFPRLRLTAWDLLYCALRECVGKRNEKAIPVGRGDASGD